MRVLHSIAIIAALLLLAAQLQRLWLQPDHYLLIGAFLLVPVLAMLPGLFLRKLYTIKWSGFVALYYFTWGISELFAAPQWHSYATLTSFSSVVLFLALIYLAKILKQQRAIQ